MLPDLSTFLLQVCTCLKLVLDAVLFEKCTTVTGLLFGMTWVSGSLASPKITLSSFFQKQSASL